MADIQSLVSKWSQSPQHAAQMLHTAVVGRTASYQPLPDWLHPDLAAAVTQSGITQLYTHQREAMDHAYAGRDVVLVTPTASGKSLAYNLPVLQTILTNPDARAFYLFPTKALAQDQYASLYDLIQKTHAQIATHTFDGDTPADARAAIREMGHIILTNPDMLHSAILPQHPRWVKAFSNLRYVVIDEMHTYRGVFGSHMANVLRRIQRIARFHGSNPTFIFCSATLANPRELAEALVERPVELVDRSGAPTSTRHVVLYNPPVVNRQLGVRANYLKQTRTLALDLVKERVSTIVFASSRLNVEILVKYLREALAKEGLPEDWVQGYRGGYLPNRRREIERGLRAGEIRCVIATNALELGIDIGSLEAAIVAGYPGSLASLVQQWGRAGRKSSASLAVMVGRSHPVDQYILSHPGYLFETPVEEARIDPNNPFILVDHLKCAIFELPMQASEGFGKLAPERVEALLELLTHGQTIHRVKERFMWANEGFPASAISLRNIPGENFVVIDMDHDRILAEVDFVSAHTMLHENAIHNVDGVQYQVKRLDYKGRKAFVQQDATDYYTDAETYTEVRVLAELDTRPLPIGQLAHGDVTVIEKVVGYKKIRFHTSENVGYGQVSLPELQMHTMSAWLSIQPHVFEGLPYGKAQLADGLLGAVRVLHRVSAFKLMTSDQDIGYAVGDGNAEWYSVGSNGTAAGYTFAQDQEAQDAGQGLSPMVFLFDRRPGGVGFGPRVYELMPELLERTRELIAHCQCERGCPACIGPSLVGLKESHNGKEVALALLSRLVVHE